MYDFKSLSAYDFEVLVRDLLQKHLGVFLESFKSGRDKGVDLRHAVARGGSLIIQCKHYAETGYAGLLTALKKEVPKVKRLTPLRYCVATSVALSPANKTEIDGLFKPFCKGTQDIFGMGELNNLLGQFSQIERQHFKLWLASTTLLERILHSGLYNQSSVFVQTIQDRAKRYVQNRSFFDALELLRGHNYCIISGIPGIGKTFLAEILLLQHISSGYQPVIVRSHIREAFEMLNPSANQVFYYDDFLGQTGWEDKLKKNEEQSILDFVTYVKTHTHAKFLLTTREYILQQARTVYEKLRASEFDHAKCIIRLESYTRRNRAHILFNHVYFSSLPTEHKRALVHRDTLLAIVDHKNYSPRIIEWMADFQNVRDCTQEDYPKRFLDTLANPSELWRHAFRNHLSPASRSLLMVMMTFPPAIESVDLKEAFEAFRIHELRRFGGTSMPSAFHTALEELEGSFIRCERDRHDAVIAFHNPSVRDFLDKFLAENAEVVHILCSSILFYDQFLALCGLRVGKQEHGQIQAALRKDPQVFAEAIGRTVGKSAKQKRLLKSSDGRVICTSQVGTTVEKNIAHAMGVAKQLPDEQRRRLARCLLDLEISRIASGTGVLGDVSETIRASLGCDGVDANRTALIDAALRSFEDPAMDYDHLNEIIALRDFMETAPDAVGPELIERVQAKLEEEADSIFDGNISNADDDSDIEHLRTIAREIAQAFGVDLHSIHERLDEREEEIHAGIGDPPDDRYEGRDREVPDASDADIVAMFGGLTE